jgi:hypothetical protein
VADIDVKKLPQEMKVKRMRYGSYGKTPRDILALRDRFVSIEPNTGCWLWMKGISDGRYGRVQCNRRQMTAHRVFYEAVHGPIAEGLQIDHLCRHTWCVNPAHLEAVTPRVNTLRSTSIQARLARQTHCKRGHPLSGDNLYSWPKEPHVRQCRECARMRHRLRRLRSKAIKEAHNG